MPTQAKWALLFFVIGIVLGGTMIALANHTIPARFKNWQAGMKQYHPSKSDKRFDELIEHDENALNYDDDEIDRSLGYAAFACFILGCIVGAVGLFNPSISKDAPVEHASQSAPASTDNIDMIVSK